MAVRVSRIPDGTYGGATFTGCTIRVSMHTADPSAPTVAEIEGGQVIGTVDGSAYVRSRIAEHEREMESITWTTLDGVQLSDAAVRFIYGDPYDLQHDPTPSGKGDPLAEVRGLSYDETLRAIDAALHG